MSKYGFKPSSIITVSLILMWLSVGCLETQTSPEPDSPGLEPLSDALVQSLAKFNRGAGLLEQYQYSQAALTFREVLVTAPNWTAARFNLGLALLNMQGEEGAKDSLTQAQAEFEAVLAVDPQLLNARFCLGLLFQHLGEHDKARDYFADVYQADPHDTHVLYKYAETLLTLEERDKGIEVLEQVVALDPGFVSALYRLAIQYQRTGKRDQARSLFARFKKLKAEELAGGSFTVSKTYGTTGRYYLALGADNLPIPDASLASKTRVLFSPEIKKLGRSCVNWKTTQGKAEVPGLAAGDIDADGDLDLCLTGQDKQGSTVLWLNNGQGDFVPGETLADMGTCPTLGDIDNDEDLDLWLGRAGSDILFLNDGTGQLTPMEHPSLSPDPWFTLSSKLLDIDSDGDLDLLALSQSEGSIPSTFTSQPDTSRLYNNNRDGSFSDLSASFLDANDPTTIASIVYDDFDNDRDLDLLVWGAQGGSGIGWVNDRAWQFRKLGPDVTKLSLEEPLLSAVSGDPDADGDRDLLLFTTQGMHLYINQGRWRFDLHEGFENRFGKLSASGGQFADMDNDGDLDILIADAKRRNGKRGPVLLLNQDAGKVFTNVTTLDPGNLLETIESPGWASCVAADFTGNGFLDCFWVPIDQPPLLIQNVTSGGHWIQIDLMGKRGQDQKSRSNNSAIGARVDIKTGLISQHYTVGTTSGPVATPPLRIHAGLGPYTQVDWLRITWPDAVLQAELEVPANQVIEITEVPRKISSCPHLFAWDGQHFELVSDFGGMGGMGYLAEPGIYPTPDPTEYVPIPNLKAKDGHYVLQVLEPIEEAVYFDEAKLLAVDHPIGTRVYPQEMMAVTAAPPAFELFTIRDTIEAFRVTDHRGADVTKELSAIDRRYAGATQIDEHFVGFANEHFVELDYGDRLQAISADDRLVLFIQGWVHYSYSSVNFAAAQAGKRLEAPTISVYRDGRWQTLFQEIGYPAGLRHMMTLEVTGKILPSDRRLRITSNMELYYDRIFLASLLSPADLRIQEVAVREADLHFLGYPKEVSPDGRHPNLYDYDSVDRTIPWKTMTGHYTRYGNVTELMHEADDCYAIMGPGDELTLTFAVSDFAPLGPGQTRSFILKTDSYCKDMDLYTATPETLEPLPFHGMSQYPYDTNESYPQTQKHQDYQREYNTRKVQDRRYRR